MKPSSNQVNLASCCVMPPDLTAFAKEFDIQLLTHNDPKGDDLSTTPPHAHSVPQRPELSPHAKGFFMSRHVSSPGLEEPDSKSIVYKNIVSVVSGSVGMNKSFMIHTVV